MSKTSLNFHCYSHQQTCPSSLKNSRSCIFNEYQNFNHIYNQGLALRNMELNGLVNCLQTQATILDGKNRLEKRRSVNERQQFVRSYSKKQLQLVQTKTAITRLKQSHQLISLRSDSCSNNLLTTISHLELDKYQNFVRLKQKQLQSQNMRKEKDEIIINLRERIEGYQKEVRRLEEENGGLRVLAFKVGLEEKYGGAGGNKENQKRDMENANALLRKKIEDLEKDNAQLRRRVEQQGYELTEKQKQLTHSKQTIKQLRKILSQPKSPQKTKPIIQINLEQRSLQQQKQPEEKLQPQPQQTPPLSLFQQAQGQGILASIATLRNGINQQIFHIFTACLVESEQKKRNGLAVFIEKWRTIQIQRIEPYVKAYFQAADQLVQYLTVHARNVSEQLRTKIREILPVSLCYDEPPSLPQPLQSKSPFVYKTYSSAQHAKNLLTRSQLNIWILSTIQFTNNQYTVSQPQPQTLKSSILYLFRLLTIEYRVLYPPKGKESQYRVDGDVRGCLLHYVVEGLKQVIIKM